LKELATTLHPNACTIDARELTRKLSAYRDPDTARGVIEIVITAAPLALLWALMWLSLEYRLFWLYAPLAVAAAGFLVRLFMIQHDCGHGAFFPTRKANDWVGRIIGVLTLTPYDYWRRTHAAHHASSGNLDRRGMGEIDTLTVGEFQDLPRWKQRRYGLYRHPAVMFGLGPLYLFFVQNRIPVGLLRAGWQPWISVMATNAAIAVLVAGAIWLLGLQSFLFLHLPVAMLAASIGVWLFYVQHQFEETSWVKNAAWDVHEAALHGSSYYDLPGVLRWFSANIGAHHVHHLASRIPYYRLPRVMQDHPQLQNVGRLTLAESFRCVPLVLWDEEQKRLISFRELRARG
jgi:acyl-lipid omega-6 desaturase (Delta-12 desaturase)